MAGPDSGPGITVEVFVKEHQIAPMWVRLKLLQFSEHRPAALLILKEYARHTARQFSRHFPQGHHLSRPGRELDLELVPEVVMELLERLDQQVVHREPDRSTPVGVPAEQSGRGFPW